MKKTKFLVLLLSCHLSSYCQLLKAQYIPTHERLAQDLEVYGHENGLNFYRQPTPIIKAYRAVNTVTDMLGFKSVHHALLFLTAGWFSYHLYHNKSGKLLKLFLPPIFWFSTDFALDLLEHGASMTSIGLAREKSAVQLERAKAAFEETQKTVRTMCRYPID